MRNIWGQKGRNKIRCYELGLHIPYAFTREVDEEKREKEREEEEGRGGELVNRLKASVTNCIITVIKSPPTSRNHII